MQERYILQVPQNEFETAKQILIQEGIMIVYELKIVKGFIVEISAEIKERLKSQHQNWKFFSDLKFQAF